MGSVLSEGEQSGLGFPYWMAVRRRFGSDDPFFAAGNVEREILAKQVALDLTEDEKHELQNIEDTERLVHCPIVGCGARLSCLDAFEDHYNARHMSACAICSRVYPTSRLLSIHVSEAHDSFFQAKVARGFSMFECLVEGCGAKLKSYKSRQQHLVDKHKFPTSFEFLHKAKPSKQRRQKLRHKQSSRPREGGGSVDMEIEEPRGGEPDDQTLPGMDVEEMDELVSAVSRLGTSDSTPASVSFGHRHARAFAFVPRSLRRNAGRRTQAER